ncbi:hypothetical protein ONZ43_g2179 [Nemania bipapillata]|uniref:Uncharacterized protein n=1 Tax=Nemania bipapillata TaxID=110536 RepID=A0ACC2J1L8_9PEZI|nr:hypothetical protein ONZ43_g2179 [Nemania bipapillata]
MQFKTVALSLFVALATADDISDLAAQIPSCAQSCWSSSAKQAGRRHHPLKALLRRRRADRRRHLQLADRRRKQAEREQRANLALELDMTRAQRDLARKQVEILTGQVRELQALNTKLVARLGREGISLDDESTSSLGSGGLTPGYLSRSATEQDLKARPN